jgi:hypothetical protein
MREKTEEPFSSRRLSRRCIGLLAVVASLVLLDRAMVQPPLLRLLTDAPTINLAGRQRMLSQRPAIPYAAISEAFSKRWKLSVIRVVSGSAWVVGRPSMVSWTAALKSANVGW